MQIAFRATMCLPRGIVPSLIVVFALQMPGRALQVEELVAGGNTFDGNGPIAVDGSGNTYVAGSDQVFRIEPDGDVSVILDEAVHPGYELGATGGLAVDDQGNVWVQLYGLLLKITPSGSVIEVADLRSEGSNFEGLVLDAAGNACFLRWEGDPDPSLVCLIRVASDGSATIQSVLEDPGLLLIASFALTASPTEPARVVVSADLLLFPTFDGSLVLEVLPDGTVTQLMGPEGDGMGNPLERAVDVAVDGAGNLYVADSGFGGFAPGRVFQIADGGGISVWSTSPLRAAAVDPVDDHVFLLGAGALFEFSPDGDLVRSVPLSGSSDPQALAVDSSGNVFVVGGNADNVVKVAPDSTTTEVLDSTGDGSAVFVREPRGLAVASTGDVYFADAFYGRFYRRTPSGELMLLYESAFPNDVGVDASGSVYVLDSVEHRVRLVDPGGEITDVIDSTGDGIHQLGAPWSLAFDAAGNMYVAGALSRNAFRVAPTGEIVQIIDSTGDGVSALGVPRPIAVDNEGNVYVGGAGTDNVFRIAGDGTITEVLDAAGDGTSPLDEVRDICVDRAGNVYVTGYLSDNAFRISPSGVITELIDASGDGVNGLDGPRGITATPAGSVFVVGGESHNVFEILPDGTITEVVDSDTLGLGSLHGPWEVVSDDSGNVYLTGNRSGNVVKISGRACTVQPAASFRSGGTNPPSYTVTPASVGGTLHMTVNLATTGHSQALVLGFDSPFELTLAGGQTLLCLDLLGSGGELINTGFHPGSLAEIDLAVPNEPALAGFHVSTQALHAFGVVPFALSNAQDVVIGGCP